MSGKVRERACPSCRATGGGQGGRPPHRSRLTRAAARRPVPTHCLLRHLRDVAGTLPGGPAAASSLPNNRPPPGPQLQAARLTRQKASGPSLLPDHRGRICLLSRKTISLGMKASISLSEEGGVPKSLFLSAEGPSQWPWGPALGSPLHGTCTGHGTAQSLSVSLPNRSQHWPLGLC